MKLQAHLPTVTIGARDWRPPMFAWASLLVAAVLLLALHSGILLNKPLLEHQRRSSVAHPDISVTHRVTLDVRSWRESSGQSRQFSVAHALPQNVALSQPFSVGRDQRIAFEVFGDAVLRDLMADEKTERHFRLDNNRMLLMLMLYRLNSHRR
ncbi:MAG TPA: hypothetical protein VE243_00470 [Candidatus Acidoferrum sp.]|nr:hypothetical protein [Candidatus Acidoferrum sp.]